LDATICAIANPPNSIAMCGPDPNSVVKRKSIDNRSAGIQMQLVRGHGGGETTRLEEQPSQIVERIFDSP